MTRPSSAQDIPEASLVPSHVAIIMDGNGRWATSRYLPRVAGHAKGVEAVRGIVKACISRGISHLTLFAFSSENWRRPAEEVSLLMRLFSTALEREVSRMLANGIRLRIVGDLSRFDPALQQQIADGGVALCQPVVRAMLGGAKAANAADTSSRAHQSAFPKMKSQKKPVSSVALCSVSTPSLHASLWL